MKTTKSPDSDTVLRVSRVFNAPRDKVYRAWTDPEELAKWWGPDGMTPTIEDFEARPGGRYRTGMRAPVGSEFWVGGEFAEVVPNERLVFGWAWQEDGVPGHETRVTVEFRDADGGTEVVLLHELFLDATSRDQHQDGWSSSFDCLARIL